MKNTTTLPVFDTTAPYHIKREYYRDGFAAFQKKFVMKRNYVMMALFFVLLVSFVVSAVADPSNKTAYFLMMICLAAIFMLWYNPRKQRRMVLDAVQELEFEQFTACNDGKVLRIRIQQGEDETEQIPESRIPLATAYVQEFEEFYLVCDGKKMFYVLPKSALEQSAEALPEQSAEEA
jgi:hypothetical protein